MRLQASCADFFFDFRGFFVVGLLLVDLASSNVWPLEAGMAGAAGRTNKLKHVPLANNRTIGMCFI